MTAQDKAGFNFALRKLAKVFRFDVDAEMVDSYFQALKSMPLRSVEVACSKAAADLEFFPKPFQLRALAPAAYRPQPREVDGNPAYECFRCRDTGTELGDRLDPTGRVIGTFARPCLCPGGEAVARAWEVPSGENGSMADSARANSRKLRDMGATEVEK